MNERPNFELNENPEYNETIGKLIPNDPANAEVFNRVFSEALNNIHYTKQQLEKVKTTADGALPASQKGTPGGVASLDSKGKLAQMPTAAEVGAAPSAHNHDGRYYTEAEMDAQMGNKANVITDLAELGLSLGSETIVGMAEALPDKYFLAMEVGDRNNSQEYPFPVGVLRAYKQSITRVVFEFDSKPIPNNLKPRKWIATYDSRYEYVGWERIPTEAEMNTRLGTKADTGNHQLKTYTTLKQLGLSGQVSMAQVCAALPNDSVFQMYTSTTFTDCITDPPTNYSFVRAFAAAGGAYCEAWSTGAKKLFVGSYRSIDTPTFSGWREVTIAARQLAAMASQQARQDVAIEQLQQANAALLLQVAGGESSV